MRIVLLAVFLGSMSLAGASAQAPSPRPPSLALSPTSGGPATPYQAHAADLPPSAPAVAVLFDPSGGQLVVQTQTDAAGSLNLTLEPPGGAWQVGLYRLAIGFGDGQSVSATFATEDGQPHLYAEPALPSPTSALIFMGIGFPAHSTVRLVMMLTGGEQGQRDIQATSDGDGSFSLYVWPQQLGLAFFAAGQYKVLAPDQNLAADFTIREHPMSSAISVADPVLPDSSTMLSFQYYARDRYLWGVYADLEGHVAGEFLVGPTDVRGDLGIPVRFTGVTPGQYLLATPYDWGETTFVVPAPTPTPTATATRTPDPTPTAKAKRSSAHKCTKSKKKCRQKHHR